MKVIVPKSNTTNHNDRVEREIKRCTNDGLHTIVATEGGRKYIVGAYGERRAAELTLQGYIDNPTKGTSYELHLSNSNNC